MNKINKNEKGFSALETVLVLAAVAAIGVVGYVVHNNHHIAAKPTINSSSSANSTAHYAVSPTNYIGWQSYSDSKLSLKYPKDWTQSETVVGDSTNAIKIVNIGSDDLNNSSYYSMPDNLNSAPPTMVISLTEDSNKLNPNPIDCVYGCKIVAVYPLNIKNSDNSNLLIVNVTFPDTNLNMLNYTELVVVNGAHIGLGNTQLVNGFAKINDKNIEISGMIDYSVNKDSPHANYPFALVSNLQNFEKSAEFQNTVNVLNSLIVN